MTYIYKPDADGKFRQKNWAVTIGEWIVKIVAFPFVVIGTAFVSLYKDNPIPFGVMGLIIAIAFNLNSYWVQFYDYPSLSPVPGLFESYLSIQDALSIPFNVGSLLTNNATEKEAFLAWWLCAGFSGLATVIQSQAITSNGTFEELKDKFKHYQSLECPPADVDYSKNVTMAAISAKELRNIDTKEHFGSWGLTFASWAIEIALTMSGMHGLSGFMWVVAFLYSGFVSVLPEWMVTRVQKMIETKKHRDARRAEARRGGA
jgi:hypothetical protein